jgi:hypothetical protein
VQAVKISLISATSILALFSAAVGPASAATLNAVPAPLNIYDLVHDGVTSSDGGDGTVSMQDLSVSAVVALEAASGGLRTVSFTGKTDQAAADGKAYPLVPLGAAAGAGPNEDLVTPDAGTAQWDAYRKVRAIAEARLAPLIGTIGSGPTASEKAGSTVFVSAGSPVGFNDGGNADAGPRGSSKAVAFAPSSTSTATITVAGAGNLSRQWAGNGLSVVAANSLRAGPPAIVDASRSVTPQTIATSDTAQPTLGYNYAPVANPAAKSNTVAASFSDAVTATGAQVADRVMPATVQTSQLQPGQGQPGRAAVSGKVQISQLQPEQSQPARLQTSEAAADLTKLLDLSQPAQGPRGNTQGDGTRTFISASVSADPTVATARYMANVVNSTPVSQAGQSVEALLISPSQPGPAPGAKTPANAATAVSDQLGGKILASAGPLNSTLALP